MYRLYIVLNTSVYVFSSILINLIIVKFFGNVVVFRKYLGHFKLAYKIRSCRYGYYYLLSFSDFFISDSFLNSVYMYNFCVVRLLLLKVYLCKLVLLNLDIIVSRRDMERYVNSSYCILSRFYTNLSSLKQRLVSDYVSYSRHLAVLPYPFMD